MSTEATTTPALTWQEFAKFTDNVDAVHTLLEDLTPPEALAVLKAVTFNLKSEVRDFNSNQ